MKTMKILPLILLASLLFPLSGSSDKSKKQPSKDKVVTAVAAIQALPEKAKELAHEANDAVATKLAETKLAIEHKRAEHAQNQLEETREMVEAFREELEKTKKELEITKRALQDVHTEAQIIKRELETAKTLLTQRQEALTRK